MPASCGVAAGAVSLNTATSYPAHALQCCRVWCAVTVVSALVVLVLFLSELNNYLNTRTVEQMKVDPTLGERLTINFDITFHALPCGGMDTYPARAPLSVTALAE